MPKGKGYGKNQKTKNPLPVTVKNRKSGVKERGKTIAINNSNALSNIQYSHPEVALELHKGNRGAINRALDAGAKAQIIMDKRKNK